MSLPGHLVTHTRARFGDFRARNETTQRAGVRGFVHKGMAIPTDRPPHVERHPSALYDRVIITGCTDVSTSELAKHTLLDR